MTSLLVPLSALPGPLPDGAWVVGMNVHPRTGAESPCFMGVYRSCVTVLMTCIPEQPRRLYLDLSPPPLDADGWPTRVDGYPIGLTMLARREGIGQPEALELAQSMDGWELLDGGHRVRLWRLPSLVCVTDPREALAILLREESR